jgi:hypothetical protein
MLNATMTIQEQADDTRSPAVKHTASSPTMASSILRQEELNALLEMIENEENLSVPEMLDRLEHPERYVEKPLEELILESVHNFAKNIDYAQAQVESVAKEIGDSLESTPDVTVTEFMQARLDTFARNLGMLSSLSL